MFAFNGFTQDGLCAIGAFSQRAGAKLLGFPGLGVGANDECDDEANDWRGKER